MTSTKIELTTIIVNSLITIVNTYTKHLLNKMYAQVCYATAVKSKVNITFIIHDIFCRKILKDNLTVFMQIDRKPQAKIGNIF